MEQGWRILLSHSMQLRSIAGVIELKDRIRIVWLQPDYRRQTRARTCLEIVWFQWLNVVVMSRVVLGT